MGNQPLAIPHGIYRNGTEYQSKGRYYDANLVRFYQGTIRPIGGWRKKSTTALTGTGRSVLTWRDNSGGLWTAIGTNSKLYAMSLGGVLSNITPFRSTGTLGNNPFAVTSGSHTVTVTHASHGLTVGDTVLYSGATSIGGLSMNGEWVVVTAPDANTYTFTHTGASNANASGGGASVLFSYEISPGLADAQNSIGYGAASYGDGVYGAPRSASTTVFDARVWRLESWGQYLNATPGDDGAVYEWRLDVNTRAQVISAAGSARGLVATDQRILTLLGAGGNPRGIKWSDQEDNTDYTATALNQAGDFNLQTGGKLICGKRAKGGATLLFTDVDVWQQSYIGGTLVYGFDKIGDKCGIISAGAVDASDVLIPWMGKGQFWLFNGFVQPIPCEVSDYVFTDMNLVQASKITCHYLSQFGEFWWFYPSKNATENDRYVTWAPNAAAGSQWTIGQMARLAGADAGVLAFPIRVADDGYVYEHEAGVIDITTYTPYLESGPIDLGAADRTMDVMNYIPDEATAGDVELTLKFKMYPNDPETTFGPFTAANPSNVRTSGRQMKVRYTAVTASDWRVGVPKLDVRPGSGR